MNDDNEPLLLTQTPSRCTGLCCFPCCGPDRSPDSEIEPASKICSPDWKEVDWIFWGNWLFVAGSAMYLINGVMTFFDDISTWDNEAANYLSLIASVNYIFDAIFYWLAWYVDIKYAPIEEAIVEHGKETDRPYQLWIKDIPAWMEKFDYTLWGAVLFLIGSFGYAAQAVLIVMLTYDPENSAYNDWQFYCGTFGAMIFLLDSAVYIYGWWLNKRSVGGTDDERFMFSFKDWRRVDWSGYGDWIFVVGSCLYIVTNFDSYYFLSDEGTMIANIVNLVAAFIFMVDPFMYFISDFAEDALEREAEILDQPRVSSVNSGGYRLLNEA